MTSFRAQAGLGLSGREATSRVLGPEIRVRWALMGGRDASQKADLETHSRAAGGVAKQGAGMLLERTYAASLRGLGQARSESPRG